MDFLLMETQSAEVSLLGETGLDSVSCAANPGHKQWECGIDCLPSECLLFPLQLYLLLLQQKRRHLPTTSTCPQVALQQW